MDWTPMIFKKQTLHIQFYPILKRRYMRGNARMPKRLARITNILAILPRGLHGSAFAARNANTYFFNPEWSSS